MTRTWTFRHSSVVPAPPHAVWNRVVTPEGINDEMRPWMTMSIPRGVGDVSMAAAELVGASGHVHGIDRAPAALSLARARVERAGMAQVTFADGDIYTYTPDRTFDALVGRFILLHVPDPVGAIRRLTAFLNPGATVAFIEMDIDQAGSVPKIPLLAGCVDIISQTYRKVGVEPNMGENLYATFRSAQLSPELTGMTRITNASDMVIYGFIAQTITSLMPAIEKSGIASAETIDVPTLAERLQEQAVAGDVMIMMPRLVGAWARIPG